MVRQGTKDEESGIAVMVTPTTATSKIHPAPKDMIRELGRDLALAPGGWKELLG